MWVLHIFAHLALVLSAAAVLTLTPTSTSIIDTSNTTLEYNVSTTAGRASLRALVRNLTLANWTPWVGLFYRELSASEQLTYAEPILGALSSLAVMNLTEEVAKGRQWIAAGRLNFERIKERIRTWPVVNQYLGSLLSLYALTGDHLYLNHSIKVAEVLSKSCFNQPRIGHQLLGANIEPLWEKVAITPMDLAHMGAMAPEYGYLSSLKPNVSDRARPLLQAALDFSRAQSGGLFPASLNAPSWQSINGKLTLQSGQAAFFTALLARHRLKVDNGSDWSFRLLKTFLEVTEAARRHRLLDVSKGGNLFLRDKSFSKKSGEQGFAGEPVMTLEGCVHGGNLLLASWALKEAAQKAGSSNFSSPGLKNFTSRANFSAELAELGERLVETCHLAANRTATRLPPQNFLFSEEHEAVHREEFGGNGYAFDSGIARSYFIAWRLTQKEKYRQYAAELLIAIERHTKVPDRHQTAPALNWARHLPISDVDVLPTRPTGYFQRFIGSYHATLRYLYLTLTEAGVNQEVFPLEKWTFTVGGHPLPVNTVTGE